MRDVVNIDMATKFAGPQDLIPVYISGAAKGGFAHPDA
jgi:isopentenyl diphosphate isomerase/L-lactate dehydrogenase-like FMN-dependent dehydrogenase